MNSENIRPNNIALFLGNDVSTHILMNELVPALIEDGYRPFIYFPSHTPSKKAALPELQEQAFFERTLPAEVIYPFLDARQPPARARCRTPKQIGEIYGIVVKDVADVNDPAFLAELDREGIDAAIVVRGYQKFRKPIIERFNGSDRPLLWNLHPGILPEYRGVMTFFRAMNDGRIQAGYSLHVIDEDWDAGPVMDIRPEPLRLSEAMLSNYCAIAPSGVPIIMDNLGKVARGEPTAAIPQDENAKGYYTFPTRVELDAFLDRGLRLVDPARMKAVYLENFSVEGTEHHRALAEALDAAIRARLGPNHAPPAAETPPDPANG